VWLKRRAVAGDAVEAAEFFFGATRAAVDGIPSGRFRRALQRRRWEWRGRGASGCRTFVWSSHEQRRGIAVGVFRAREHGVAALRALMQLATGVSPLLLVTEVRSSPQTDCG